MINLSLFSELFQFNISTGWEVLATLFQPRFKYDRMVHGEHLKVQFNSFNIYSVELREAKIHQSQKVLHIVNYEQRNYRQGFRLFMFFAFVFRYCLSNTNVVTIIMITVYVRTEDIILG